MKSEGMFLFRFLIGTLLLESQRQFLFLHPPSRPVVQNFDGDPLAYWPFIRTVLKHTLL